MVSDSAMGLSPSYSAFQIRRFTRIQDIPEPEWQKLVPTSFPFWEYHFLLALETTDCVGSRTGWIPIYLTLWQDTKLKAALLTFVKNNSYGEYIFDFAWAELYQSVQMNYYPKMVSAVPFTPATGPKILLDPDFSSEEQKCAADALLVEWNDISKKIGVSSQHALFIHQAETAAFVRQGFFVRHSFQFHWQNKNYKHFDDFLVSLKSKRRREIRRERLQVSASGIQISRLTGQDLTEEHAILFYGFYLNTVEKRQGHDYLTPDFFRTVFRKMKDQIFFVLARNAEGEAVAGALNYFGKDTLFGRHWGCLEEYKFLHFEVCFYQGIEFAIEKKITLFEAGAQGEHKFHRGFLPTLTYSAHRIENPRLSSAIEDFSRREQLQIKELFLSYNSHNPYAQAVSK